MDSDIKVFRIAHQLTQTEMGDILGISKGMVALLESNRREMSVKIMAKMTSARDERLANGPDLGGEDPGLLQRLTEQHIKKSIGYLFSYKKDCEGQLHNMEKQVESWKKRYSEACYQIFTAEITMVEVKNEPVQAEKVNITSSITRRAAAETIIRSIMDEQPEIEMIKMDGFREQLRRIKSQISSKKKQLKLKKFGSLELPGAEPPGEKIIDVEEMVARAHTRIEDKAEETHKKEATT